MLFRETQYSRPTAEQYALLGEAVVDWSIIDLLVESLIARLARAWISRESDMQLVCLLLCLFALAPIGAQAADAAMQNSMIEGKAELCAACHGQHGQSTQAAWPSLAG